MRVLLGILILVISLAAVTFSKSMYGGYPIRPPMPPVAYDEDVSRQEEGQYTSCPASESLNYAVHLPHPTCTLYYICVYGVPVERPCANGTHWNPRNITCDWPRDAQCQQGAAQFQPNAITLY